MSKKVIAALMVSGFLSAVPFSAVAQSVNSLVQQAKIDCDDLQKLQEKTLENVVVSRMTPADQMPSAQVNKMSSVVESANKMLSAIQSGNIFSAITNQITSKIRQTVMDYSTNFMLQNLRKVAGDLTASLGIKNPTLNSAVNNVIGSVSNTAATAGGSAIQGGVNSTFDNFSKSDANTALNTATSYGDSKVRGVATEAKVYVDKTGSAVSKGYEDFKTQIKPQRPAPSESPAPPSSNTVNSSASWFR